MANIHNNTSLFMDKQPGGDFTVIDQAITTGDVYFVDSNTGTDSAGRGRSPQDPVATVDYAIDLCTASQGDTIYVMPAHAETGSTASQELFNVDSAGISIIGLGVGDKRPTFTFGEATVTAVLGAANCRLSNLRFISAIADLATALEIEAAATGCKVDNCYFADTAAAEMLVAVAIEANADGLIFENNHINGAISGDATEALNFAGGSDGCIIQGNLIRGDWDTGGILEMSTAASTDITICNNYFSNNSDDASLCYNGHASSTGGIYRNYFHGDKAGVSPVATMDGLFAAENYGMDEPAKSGIILGAAATAWS